jgi:hypothetical protein
MALSLSRVWLHVVAEIQILIGFVEAKESLDLHELVLDTLHMWKKEKGHFISCKHK